MASVIFHCDRQQELEYCLQLLKEKDWFESERFPVFLPRDISGIKKEIFNAHSALKHKIVRLQKSWKQIETEYFQIVRAFHCKKISKQYRCCVSMFGPQGRYHHPNKFWIRLRTREDKNQALATIGHELLHLIFYDLFESNKLTYYECEGMVDALILNTNLSKLFPKYQKQSIGKVRYKLLKEIITRN